MTIDSEDRKSKRREDIVTAALNVFSHKGYNGAQISDIIKEAGIARGTFYLYFKSKREILSAVLENIFKEVQSVVETLPRDAISEIPSKIQGNLERVTKLFLKKPEYARILFAESVSLDPESVDQLKIFYGLLLDLIGRAVRQGQEMGFVREADVSILAVSILGCLKELFYQQSLGEIKFTPSQAVDELFQTILAMVKK